MKRRRDKGISNQSIIIYYPEVNSHFEKGYANSKQKEEKRRKERSDIAIARLEMNFSRNPMRLSIMRLQCLRAISLDSPAFFPANFPILRFL
jgi:hypothetical protein